MLILSNRVKFLRYEVGKFVTNVLWCFLLLLIFDKVFFKKDAFSLTDFRAYRLCTTEKLIMKKGLFSDFLL